MAAAAHRDMQSVIPREIHRRDDVRRSAAAGDQRRLSVEHAVPQLACRVVGVIAGAQQWPAQARLKLLDRLVRNAVAGRTNNGAVAHLVPLFGFLALPGLARERCLALVKARPACCDQ